jgi:tyrosyl-tRNA synthetase
MSSHTSKKETVVITDEKRIDEVLSRGVEEVIKKEDLKKKMLSGERLRIKLGIDPTSPHLHLGRSVPLLKMRDFQNLGHQVVLIIGDFTGVVGDTSDKDSERPMLEQKTIEENKKKYFDQIKLIIDLDTAEFRYNSEWLSPLTYAEIGVQADAFSVADFIARDNIRRRLDAGTRVSLREMLYPMMQGYDSVAIQADVELGGSDQRFNLLAGRTLQEKFGQEPQNIITTPLIEGLDGRKMSSSWGNTITFTETPDNMYGKIMSIKDELIIRYFTVLTRIPEEKIKDTQKGLSEGKNPKEAKMCLAREIVTLYHNKELAEQAEQNFEHTFKEGGIPEDILERIITDGELLIDTLVLSKNTSSKTEARRLIVDGAIKNAETGEKYTDDTQKTPHNITLKIGKKNFLKII